MSDKNLSGEEKRKLLKEQFKKEFQERKEFLQKVKQLRQVKKINKALADMTPQDDTDEWINRLNEETAFNEAKLEMATDAAKEMGDEELKTDEELKKIVAEQMVAEMKKTLLEEEKVISTHEKEEDADDEEDESDQTPKKTLGDLEI